MRSLSPLPMQHDAYVNIGLLDFNMWKYLQTSRTSNECIAIFKVNSSRSVTLQWTLQRFGFPWNHFAKKRQLVRDQRALASWCRGCSKQLGMRPFLRSFAIVYTSFCKLPEGLTIEIHQQSCELQQETHGFSPPMQFTSISTCKRHLDSLVICYIAIEHGHWNGEFSQ